MQLYNSPAYVSQGATPAQNTVSGYGGASGRGWDNVSVPATCTLAYDNTYAVQPNGFDIEVLIGATAGACMTQWMGNMPPLTNGSYWFREGLYFTANPSNTMTILGGCCVTGSAKAFDVIVTSTGKIEVRDSANAIVITFTNSIPLNTRFRIEGSFVPSASNTGQVTVSLYPTEFSTVATETKTSAATMNFTANGGSLGIRYGQAFGGNANVGPYRYFGAAISNTGPIGPGAILQQMIAGAPSQNGFTVVSKVVGATACRLKIATDQAMTQNVMYAGPQVPDQYGYVRHQPTGLKPFTRYYVQLTDIPVSTGVETTFGSVGSCKTLAAAGAPASFTVAFASCIATADITGPASYLALQDWANWQADLNVFTGDYAYFDPTYTDVPSQIGVFESQTHHAADGGAGYMQQMLSSAWGFYCASDHDTGPDNGDSNVAQAPWITANQAARQEVFPFGNLGDVERPVHGLYQSWVSGRVRFIMVDIRNTDRSTGSNTDNGAKTMLGATQLNWFFDQLTQPEPLKIVIGDTQWMGNQPGGQYDKWWAYDTERQAIISFIQANQAAIGNMMWWHGDFHGLGCTPGANNSWGGFPVYCAAPLVQTGSAVQDQSTFTQMYNNGGGECRQYGRVTITDSGPQITVAFQGWDAVNQVAQISQTDTFNVGFTSATLNVWNGSEWVPVSNGTSSWASVAAALSSANAYTDAETTRAKAAESANATAISTETTRAEAAEALRVLQSTVGQPSGVASLDSSGGVPSAQLLNPSLASYWDGQELAAGETCIPRFSYGAVAALTSGKLIFSCWTATRTETINNVAVTTNNTVAGATPTYCAMGVWQVNGDGSLTLLGQCANDTTMFSSTFTQYERPLTSSFLKVQGVRYAFGVLVVSSQAMPNFFGCNGSFAFGNLAPQLAGYVNGLSSLPTTIASGFTNGSQMILGAVLP